MPKNIWYQNPKTLELETLFDLANARPSAYFHARMSLFEAAKKGHLDCVKIAAELCDANGFAPVLLETNKDWAEVLIEQPDHIHIFLGDTPYGGENVFYCVPSYFHGYWYFDPMGSRNNSSIRNKTFTPEICSLVSSCQISRIVRVKPFQSQKESHCSV